MKSKPLTSLFRTAVWSLVGSITISGMAFAANMAVPVQVTAPPNDSQVGGSHVGILAEYDSESAVPVALRLYVDDHLYQTVSTGGASSGTCRFVWNTSKYSEAAHQLTVELVSKKAVIGRSSLRVYVNNGPVDEVPPIVGFYGIHNGSKVSGETRLTIDASDNAEVSYVQLFIDKNLKLITNSQPYAYLWDTTSCENGPHYLQATAIDSSDNQGTSKTLKVFVDNPLVMKASNLDEYSAANADNVAAVPVLTLPIAPKDSAQIAGQSAPSLVSPAPAPIQAVASPKQKDAETVSVSPKVTSAAPKSELVKVASTKASSPEVAMKMSSEPRVAESPVHPIITSGEVSAHSSMEAPSAKASLAASAPVIASAPVSAKPLKTAEMKPTGIPVVSITDNAAPSLTAPVVVMANASPVASLVREAEAPVVPTVTPRAAAATKASAKKTAAPAAVAPVKHPAKSAAKPSAETKPVTVKAVKNVNCVYVAKKGESVEGVSKRTRVSSQEIKNANKISTNKLHAGQHLRIPMGIRLVIDQKDIKTDVATRVENGIAMAPIRQTVENEGGQIAWSGKSHRVTAERGQKQVMVKIGSRSAKIDGVNKTMPVAPCLVKGRTLVPLRFVQNALDISVQYDPSTNTVYMSKQ